MVSTHKLKSVDFFRKIPRDLTEASLSGAGLSIIAALSMIFLFGMELNDYLTMSTSTSVVVDRSVDGEFLMIHFNISFPALSCEFASVDLSDVLGTNRLNITKAISKYPISQNLIPASYESYTDPVLRDVKHDDDEDVDEENTEGSISLNGTNLYTFAQRHPILVVNFFAPWCYWSNRLKPSWEKTAKIIHERYDPERDGRILLGKVDCTADIEFCRRQHVQGYPSIRIFRKGNDVREDHGHHEHESYYGDRDTESLVNAMENLLQLIPSGSQQKALEGKPSTLDDAKRPAPLTGGCRIEGSVRVKKVPGNLVIAARSKAHSFDASQMNMSHIISSLVFSKRISDPVVNDIKRWLPYLGRRRDRLRGKEYITHTGDSKANVTIEHYIQVVKTEVVTHRYHHGQETMIEEYEYTAHSSLVHSPQVPVVKFHFDPSPMQVLISENRKSFSHFLTNICAIIGGVFTVAGILDSILHNTVRLVKKVELGKNS